MTFDIVNSLSLLVNAAESYDTLVTRGTECSSRQFTQLL